MPAIALVFNIPPATCLRHNRSRPHRFVGEEVLEEHQRQFAAALSRLPLEGYHRIYLLNETGIAEAVIKKTGSTVSVTKH